MKTKKPPFELDLTRRNTLAAQMEDSLRQAIASGWYRPGDALPTVREWAKMLGVSPRVPKTVIPRLMEEGLIIARPRHGCIVAPRESLSFRGHVLAVMPPEAHFGNSNVTFASMARRLEDAGYLVSSVRVRRGTGGKHDFRSLRLALRQSVDVAVFFYQDPASARCAREHGVPFVTIHVGYIAGGVGHVSRNDTAAFEAMAQDFKARGIRSVGLVLKRGRSDDGHVGMLRRSGLRVEMMPVCVDPAMSPELRIEAIMQGARDYFERRFSCTCALPDVLYFEDDFFLYGAVPVLLLREVRIPEDVELASVSNYGRRPVFPFPLQVIEFNHYESGKLIAEGVLEYFKNGVFPDDVVVSPRYIQSNHSLVSCRNADSGVEC